MDETDRPDDRRADGSWVLPNSESRRQRNHEAAQSGIQKRKKTRTYPRLSCKIEYLLASNHSGRSIASEFFTGDSLVERRRLILFVWQLGAGLGNVGAQLRSMASALRHSPRVCARDACRPTAELRQHNG